MTFTIHYTPLGEQEKLNPFYWEVWQGLPELDFQNTLSAGTKRLERKPSLKYEGEKGYVWVPHDALVALSQNPNTILLALKGTSEGNKINVRTVSVQDMPVYEAILKAKGLNKIVSI